MAENAHQSAAWVDIPVAAIDPVSTALLKNFLNENGFAYELSHRFFSVPIDEVERLEERVTAWAMRPALPPDPRVTYSLDETLRDLGEVVLLAISAAKANVAPNYAPAAGIDLTDHRDLGSTEP